MNEKPAPTGASGLTSLHEGLLIAFDAMRANAIRSGGIFRMFSDKIVRSASSPRASVEAT